MKLRILPAMAAATILLSSVWLAAPAQAAEVNLVPDPILRQCLVDAMQGAGMETPTQADVITQDDLDALAATTAAKAASNNLSHSYAYSLNCGDGISTLEGLEYLHDSQLYGISARNGTISDLSPLASFTGLHEIHVGNNKISDLSPLTQLSNLGILIADNNEIIDLAPVQNMGLWWLDVSFNKVTDLSVLSGTDIKLLSVSGNDISDLTPLANMRLQWAPPSSAGLDAVGNHISDITVLPDLCTQAQASANAMLFDSLEDGWTKCVQPNLVFQTLTATAVAGTSTPLPTVLGQPDDPVTWRVTQGDATINNGLVTYPTAGTYVLQFQDTTYQRYTWIYNDEANDGTFPYDRQLDDTYTGNWMWNDDGMANAADCTVQNGTWGWNDDADRDVCSILADFSGIVTVTVSGRGEPPVAPMSDAVKKDEVAASTTGGAARLADGTDSYTLVVTLKTASGVPAPGYGDELSATVEPAGVSVSGVVDNGDGTYAMTVVSADPGNYLVTVKLNGAEVGDPIPVNFIGADVAVPSVNVANEQTATGLGFLPGEQVSVTVHSDPLSLGTYKADGLGRVSVTFSMPKGFDLGAHTVDFVGVTSGTAVAGFTVVDMSAGTGGTASPSSGSVVLALVAVLCLSAGFAVSMTVRKAR